MKILKIKDKVQAILEETPDARENDLRLLGCFWYDEIAEPQKYLYMATTFLKDFADGKYTTPEAITRCRRKLQEENESLRGKNYLKRHAETKKVKEELKQPVWWQGNNKAEEPNTLTGQTKLDI